ncbi:hypothetical protein CEXT_901 [Caerostris extrusa]|uniref:Uncharacterized protein n=1 Tax=Caerostris extrusa TaxID=172846 RepID=A0AAV4Y3R6_CAEEX|nr:hypothetical protein CEXT_901 [Caerostris extrusa]
MFRKTITGQSDGRVRTLHTTPLRQIYLGGVGLEGGLEEDSPAGVIFRPRSYHLKKSAGPSSLPDLVRKVAKKSEEKVGRRTQAHCQTQLESGLGLPDRWKGAIRQSCGSVASYLPSHDEQEGGTGLVRVRCRGPVRVRLLPELPDWGLCSRRPGGRGRESGRGGAQSSGRPLRRMTSGAVPMAHPASHKSYRPLTVLTFRTDLVFLNTKLLQKFHVYAVVVACKLSTWIFNLNKRPVIDCAFGNETSLFAML